MASAGQKRKHGDKAPVELSNGNVNLKASVNERGVVTFAPLQNRPKWNIKFCLEDVAVSGINYQPPNTISVEHERSIRELVENIEGGIEHSFAVAEGPARPFSLRLGVQTDGISQVAEHDSNLCFWGTDGPVFVYQNLVVRDANGHQVKSNMVWENEGIVLNVLETPVFPILIDPLATIPGKKLLPFKLPENLLSFLGPGAKVVDVTCSSTIANFAEDSSSDEEPIPKKPAKESSTHRKIGLPSFAKLHPSFQLPRKWLRSLYGGSKPEGSALAKGVNAVLSHSSLPHLDIGLSWDGNVRFDAKSWFLTVSSPESEFGSAELIHGPNLLVLRGENEESGISFYKDSARHFYVLNKPLAGKFTLKFSLSGVAKIEYDSDHHYLAVLEGEHARLVYSAPLLRLPSGQTSVQKVHWDGTAFSIDVPSTPESYPLVLAFSVVGKKPTGPRSLATLFPSLKIGEKGDIRDSGSSSSSSEDELDGRKRKDKKPSAAAEYSSDEDTGKHNGGKKLGFDIHSIANKLPHLKSWIGSLYGNAPELTAVKSGPATLQHSSLNDIRADLSIHGEIEYHAPGWKVKFAPNFPLTSPQVLQGKDIQLIRGEDGETGLSFDAKHTRHFFVYNKAPTSPKLLLQLEQLEGTTSLEYDPERGYIAFKDQDGKLFLVYSSPVVFLPSGEAVTVPVEWDGENSGIAIQLPQASSLTVVFGITAQIEDEPLGLPAGTKLRRVGSGKVEEYTDYIEEEEEEEPQTVVVSDVGLPKFIGDVAALGEDFISLYGDAQAPTHEISSRRAPLRPIAHLPISVGLQRNGDVEYGSPNWKITLSPSFTLTNPKLYQREGLQLLRGDEGETGFAVDKGGKIKHFFLYAKAPVESRLLLRLEQLKGATSLEFNPAAGYVALSDQQSEAKHLLVYLYPVILVPGRAPISLSLDWDGEASAIAIKFPEDVKAPFVLTFLIDSQVPEIPEIQIDGSAPAVEHAEQPHGQKGTKTVVGKIDTSAPAFAGKFGNLSLGTSWLHILYGRGQANLAPVTGNHTRESHPSLGNIHVSLADNGDVEFGTPTYKVKLAPAGFAIASPKLYRRDGLQLLRGEDSESGLSFDKDTTRHFFFFGKSAPEKLQLKLDQLEGSTKLEYNPEGYVAFYDQDGKLIFVYSAPVVRLPNNETVTLPVEWDGENSAISVKLPEGVAGPLVIAFGIAAKLPKSKRDFLSLLFPWLHFDTSGSVKEGHDEKPKAGTKKPFTFPPKSDIPISKPSEDKKIKFSAPAGLNVVLPTFAQQSTLFDLGRTWISNLYGTAEEPLAPVTEEVARYVHPSLNKLDVGLGLDGAAEFSSPDWKAKFTPNLEITNPKLFFANGVHLVRGDDGEIGLSFDKLSSRHFFFYGKQAPEKFLLTFSSAEGPAKVEYNKEKSSVAFFDAAGKVRLVYSAPTAKLSDNRTVTLGLDWDAAASAIVVTLPELRSAPLVLAFAVGLKYTELKGDKRSSRNLTPDVAREKDEAAAAGGRISHGRAGSFSGVKYHTFKLDHAWLADLYGGSNVLLTRIPDKFQKQAHPVLPNIDASLNLDGTAEYGVGDWKFKLTPIFVPIPPVPHRGDGVQVLRGEDGEIGLYHDKIASRHFFIVGRALPTTKFSLKLGQLGGNTKAEFSKEKGFVSFNDPTGKYRLVYSAPRVQTGSGKIVNPPIDWDNASSTLSVNVPDLTLPLIIAFQLGVKITMGPKFRPVRPGSGTYEPIELDEDGKPRVKSGFGTPAFLNKYPNFRLVRPWHDTLYGPTEVALTQITSRQAQPVPALGLDVGLSAGGDVEYGSPEWKIKLAPVSFSLLGAKLYKGDGLQVVRGDSNEVGISYDQHSFRHYFFFGKAPVAQKFSFKLTPLSGSVKVDLNKDKSVVTFSDHEGKLKFVYISPILLLASGKTVPVAIDWQGPSSSLVVLLPETTFPLVLAFGVGAKVPESREKSRNVSFPFFRFGPAGEIEFPTLEEKEREREVDGKKPTQTTTTTSTATASDTAKRHGFSFNLPKVSLPSFSLNFPKFKIGPAWGTTLYGRAGHALKPVPEGHRLRSAYPSLPHFEVGLSPTGEAHFDSADLKLSVAPLSFHITAPKLFEADGVQLLRGDDGEVGISFDESSARHFFFLGKAPAATKFSIKITQTGANVDFNKERGYFALVKGPVPLVYYEPIVLQANSKAVKLPLEWDAQASTLSVLLHDLSFPTIITFGLGTKIPDAKGKFGFSFPALRFSASGEVESDEDESEFPAHVAPVAKASFPASFHKGVPSPLIAESLYGSSDVALAEVPHGEFATLAHPALGLDLGLGPHGEVEFSSPTFKVKFTSNVVLSAPKLFKRDGLQVLRADDGEIGISFGTDGLSRHFFVLGKAPEGGKLSLTLEALTGGVKLKFDKYAVEISDDNDKIQFVYLSPVAQFGTRTITIPLEWDAATSSLVVSLPDSATYPLLVAFLVSPKVIEGTSRWSVGFPSLRGRLTRTGEVDERPEESYESRKKLVLPSFFSQFSPAKLLKWITTLYGPNIKADALVELPEGETALHTTLPSLGLSVSLNEDGEVTFGSSVWKGKFFPEIPVRFTKLLSHEGLQLLRHSDGEIGISYDKSSIRYFFVLNSPTKTFTLNFEQIDGSTKLEFYQDKGILSFADETEKVVLVISSPLVLSGTRTTSGQLSWDGSISVALPEGMNFPAVLTFGISATAPDPEAGFEEYFPGFRFGVDGVVVEEETEEVPKEDRYDEEEFPAISVPEEKHLPSEIGLELGKFGFSSRHPAFKLDAHWISALYGVDHHKFTLNTVPQEQASIFFHASVGNLKVSLNHRGEVTFEDSEWQLSLSTPSLPTDGATLAERDGLQVIRHEYGELGLAFDKKSSRFFVILGVPPPSPSLSIHFKLDANTHVVHAKEKGIVTFQDKSGKPKLAFASPVGHIASNENFTFPIEWDSSTHVIHIPLAHPDPVPVAFAFALYPTPPPEHKEHKGLGSVLSAVGSAFGHHHHEGYEPAVPGIDAPFYKYPTSLHVSDGQVSSPVGYPVSGDYAKHTPSQSPSSSPVPSPSLSSSTRAVPHSPSPTPAAGGPSLSISASPKVGAISGSADFAVIGDDELEFEPVTVVQRIEPVQAELFEPTADAPLQAGFSLKVSSDEGVSIKVSGDHNGVRGHLKGSLGGLGSAISHLGHDVKEVAAAIPHLGHETSAAAVPHAEGSAAAVPHPEGGIKEGSAAAVPHAEGGVKVKEGSAAAIPHSEGGIKEGSAAAVPHAEGGVKEGSAAAIPRSEGGAKEGHPEGGVKEGSAAAIPRSEGGAKDSSAPAISHTGGGVKESSAEKEREKAEHAAEKEREKAEKEREKAEHAAEKEREKAEHAAEKEKEKAEHEAEKERVKAEKAHEKELADKEKAEKAAAEKERVEKEKKEKAEKAKSEKERVEKERKEKLEKERADKARAEQEAKDKLKASTEKAKADKQKAAHEKAEKDKAAKEEKERVEKEKADKKKADKEHEKAEKEKEKAEKELEHAEKEAEKQERKAEKETEKEEKERERIEKQKEKTEKEREKAEARKREQAEKKKAEKERHAADLAKLGPLPSATFDRGFRGALYGKADLDDFVHEAPATTLYSATTNLTFEITAHDGVLSIGPAQGDAWHVRVVPVGLEWNREAARLFKGTAFVSVRSEGVEIGAQVREDSSSQFFVLGRGGPLVLRFETAGIGEVKYDPKDGETLFSDINGNPLFIYSTPALHARSKSKKIRSNISWDNNARELRMEAEGYTESLGIVCAICTKCITLPPDDVLYALPDGSFVVVHPKVNFVGQASASGITYRSLTPEEDPWSITLSLQRGKVQKVYAQSKCTVVLLRNDGIREYLAYVDRGEDYVGLHQSFHLHNPPASYPLRIPIKLTLNNISEISESSDSLITFSTKSGPVFAYGNLVVLDARGNTVASRISLEDPEAEHPRIIVEVLEEGEFPLVIG
eukprot:Phypoly_transcript_00009.p1 GENE.Phypoly_transcript_00009~~Phypoly_transcript_00009.p1  ORF type:complete len:3931 (-),score=966.04 Phypoly_transcript_00009:22-11814(-)